LRGFKEALHEHDIPLEAGRIIEGRYSPEITSRLVKEGIDRFPEFTAVFASNDLSAIAFAKASFEQKRLQISRDYSIISVDDSDYIPYFLPQISSFHLPLQTIGSIAAEMLLSQIEGSKIKEKKVVLKADFIKRDSLSTLIA
jgi:LacI family asc operon transcriptional repressor